MKLPKELTKVTSLSKSLAMLIFIVFPLATFFIGMRYQARLDLLDRQIAEQSLTIARAPTPSPVPPIDTSTWKTYTDPLNKFSFKYPNNWYYDSKNVSSNQIVVFFKEGDPEDTTLMMHQGKEQLLISILKNQNFEELEKSTNLLPMTINGKQVLQTTNAIYIEWTKPDTILKLSTSLYPNQLSQVLSTFKFTDQTSTEGQACGGPILTPCPTGYICKTEKSYGSPNYYEESGICVQQ